MILAFKLSNIIQVPFGWLLTFLYQLTTQYGVALILFALIVKLLLLPGTAKGKKSSMKMSRLSPRIKELQEKYANDPQKQNAAIQQLYKDENVSIGGSCLWSLLPLLVLLPLYAVVRQPITYLLHESAETAGVIVSVIKEQLPDLFGSNTYYQQMIAAAHIPDYVEQINAGLAAAQLPALSAASAEGVNFTFLGIDLSAIPTYNIFGSGWAWDWAHIGAFLMPLLSAGSQLLSMVISMRMNNSLVTDENGIQDKETAKNSQANQSGKVMMWMGPIMSLWIGFSMPAALSLYWLAQGLVTTVSDVYLTQKYRKIYDAEDAERLKKHMAEEALEEEKERVRAQRRAANPEGITANTSKKKLQQAKKQEEEAAKAAAAREWAMRKGEAPQEEAPEEKKTLSGISHRPYCKGRAYDPNRYNNTTEE